MTASDQAQPASSRAMATAAMVSFLRRPWKLCQRECSRRLPSWPRTLAGAGGQLPAVPQILAGAAVALAVVPGGLHQQSAGMAVAGLGDRTLGPGFSRRVLGGH